MSYGIYIKLITNCIFISVGTHVLYATLNNNIKDEVFI